MTLIYKYHEEECTLEDLVKKFPSYWELQLRKEYKFWKDIYFDDLIIETSDAFEEDLQMSDVDVEFIKNDDTGFNLNILFKPLLHMKTR